jgi:hypothetical protein
LGTRLGHHGDRRDAGKRTPRLHANAGQQGRFFVDLPLLDELAVDLHDDRLSHVTARRQRISPDRLQYGAPFDDFVQDLASLSKLLARIFASLKPSLIAFHRV